MDFYEIELLKEREENELSEDEKDPRDELIEEYYAERWTEALDMMKLQEEEEEAEEERRQEAMHEDY
ncbi:MAG: hypothetical protein QXW57_03210 [Candidatus Micrarchaeaceae archaeon]